MNIFPIGKPPKEPYMLTDRVTIRPYARVELRQINRSSFNDSVTIEGFSDDAAVGKWAVFHAFLMQDSLPLSHYESGGMVEQLHVLAEPCLLMLQSDYGDVLNEIFLNPRLSEQIATLSYRSLYQKFLQADQATFGLVCTLLLDFTNPPHFAERLMRDASFWDIVRSYSIIEHLIGEQSSTCSFKCPECGKTIAHRPKTEKEWTNQRLSELVLNEDSRIAYALAIHAVRDQIRHKTVHAARHPSASPDEFLPGITLHPLPSAIDNFRESQTALDVLRRNTWQIARRMLLERIFQLGVFPRLPTSFTASGSAG